MTLSADLRAIPHELRQRPQWLMYRLEQRDGKVTKVPYTFSGTPASTTDPRTWGTFDDALRALARGFAGIGFVFTADDPYLGVDLDHARDPADGTIADPEARRTIARLASYTEISQSGCGVHIIVRARKPGPRARVGRFEMYDAGRFFVMTGDHLAGTPTTVEDRQAEIDAEYRERFPATPPSPNGPRPPGHVDVGDAELMRRMFASVHGAEIDQLWRGDTSGYDSQSEADSALCFHLAWWTKSDAARVDALFRQSGLMRDKWDGRRGDTTYGALTITHAIANVHEGYGGGNGGRSNAARRSPRARDVIVAEPDDIPIDGDGGPGTPDAPVMADEPDIPDDPPPGDVDLAECLATTERLLRRFVHFRTDAEAVAVTLWAAHTYCWEHFEQSPILAVTSAVMQSGKTRLLDVLELIVWRPWRVILPSDAVVYRYIAERRPTLMLDEADAIFGRKDGQYEGLRALLNAGNRRGTRVPRVVGQGAKLRVEEFDVHSPKAVVGIGRIPPTVADRAIPIRMERRARSETVEKFRRADVEPSVVALRTEFKRFAMSATFPNHPAMPDELDDRAAESWECPMALADLAGGDWPERARRAAVELHADRDQDEEVLSVLLLRDVRAVFDRQGVGRLFTNDLVTALHEIESSPWGDYYGKPMTGHGLAKLLRPYRIGPQEVRIGETTKRGYRVEQFTEAWDRYLVLPATETPAPEQVKRSETNPLKPAYVSDVSLTRYGVGEGDADVPDDGAPDDADPMLRAIADGTADGRLDPRWPNGAVSSHLDGGQRQRVIPPDGIPL